MATITVNAGGNLQAALNAANPGDTILLEANAVFTGNFLLPVKSGSSYITIQTNGSFPADGTRVNPSSAAGFAKIQALAGGDPAFKAVAGSHHWNLTALHCLPNPGGFGEIIAIGSGGSDQNSLSQVPHHFIVDRCYIHGDPTFGQKRGIGINGSYITVKSSYISECKASGQDSQAISGWNGPGPFTIDNNYLEGASENFMIGGSAAYITGLIPSDLTFTNNLCSKPTAWRNLSWQVKNLFEIKNGQRATIRNNIFEWVWGEPDGQNGIPILFTVRNQDYDPNNPNGPSNNYWVTAKDIVFSQNIIRHAGGCINILGHDDRVLNGIHVPSDTASNILIQDNLWYDISESWTGSARFLQVQSGTGITLDHNTCINTQGPGSVTVYFNNVPTTNFTFTNNIAKDNGYFFFTANDNNPALNGLTGTAALNAMAPGWTVTKNAMIGGTGSGMPSGNFYPADMAAVDFTDYASDDYTLKNTSPYHLAATDGTDIGATFLTGVTITPPPPPPPPPAITLPTPWLTADIGSVGLTGSATFANNTFTVSGAGADIWDVADSFRFVYQPASGDITFTARVLSMQNTGSFAKAGVMIRQSLDPGSPHVILDVKPNDEWEFMDRPSQGSVTNYLSGTISQPPTYVKLLRSGDTITAYTSPDDSTWTEVGNVTVPMGPDVLVGMIVCSHDTSVVNTCTFDSANVVSTVTIQPPPPPPTPPTIDALLAFPGLFAV